MPDETPAPRRTPARWATAALLVAGLALGGGRGAAFADDEPVPTESDVNAARERADAAERDVAAVRADLIRANLALEAAGDRAAQAAEAFNGARWRAEQARADADDARAAADRASADLAEQRELYADTVVASYEDASQVQGLAAVVEADGIESLVDQSVTMGNTSDALDSRYDAYTAASAVAEVTAGTAADAASRADRAAAEAETARDAAADAEAEAGAQAEDVAARKSDLLAELADLQGISVRLAERRQRALERAAAEAAAAAAQAQAEQEAQEEEEEAAATRRPPPRRPPPRTPTPTPTPAPTPTPTATPTRPPPRRPPPRPRRHPTPTPTPTVGDAAAAVAFARGQIGEPYAYGAAGPDAWDCSGLTAAAWATGAKALPHYSVAQYTQSTPISASQLQPGDLVFWGSSSSPDSIYHVAMYVGDGRIVHAPRTGRDVTEESMYYWRAPNFFARP